MKLYCIIYHTVACFMIHSHPSKPQETFWLMMQQVICRSETQAHSVLVKLCICNICPSSLQHWAFCRAHHTHSPLGEWMVISLETLVCLRDPPSTVLPIYLVLGSAVVIAAISGIYNLNTLHYCMIQMKSPLRALMQTVVQQKTNKTLLALWQLQYDKHPAIHTFITVMSAFGLQGLVFSSICNYSFVYRVITWF